MTAKKIWFTWLPGEGAGRDPAPVLKSLTQYGFEVSGDNWVDDLKNVAWQLVGRPVLESSKTDLWMIAGTREDFECPSNRYGLSLLTAVVREARGADFPVLGLGLDFDPDPASMPTPLQTAFFLSAAGTNWQARVVARAHGASRAAEADYRLTLKADPHLGQWFEIGPRDSDWQGIMFGVSQGAVITHQGVGPKGQVPSKAVLEYPLKDMKAQVGEAEFTAWSVRNRLSPADSYYARVDGFPEKIIIGSHPGDDQAEVFVVTLK